MGNCQAAEAATVVIQHPTNNNIQRIYSSVSAHQVMSSNPGHYVALVISSSNVFTENGTPVKQLKILRPHHMLLIGKLYRLVSFQGKYYNYVKLTVITGSDRTRINKSLDGRLHCILDWTSNITGFLSLDCILNKLKLKPIIIIRELQVLQYS